MKFSSENAGSNASSALGIGLAICAAAAGVASSFVATLPLFFVAVGFSFVAAATGLRAAWAVMAASVVCAAAGLVLATDSASQPEAQPASTEPSVTPVDTGQPDTSAPRPTIVVAQEVESELPREAEAKDSPELLPICEWDPGSAPVPVSEFQPLVESPIDGFEFPELIPFDDDDDEVEPIEGFAFLQLNRGTDSVSIILSPSELDSDANQAAERAENWCENEPTSGFLLSIDGWPVVKSADAVVSVQFNSGSQTASLSAASDDASDDDVVSWLEKTYEALTGITLDNSKDI
jgi:hypothetical protein